MIQRQIIDLIEQYNTIIIHHHVNPDPDCIGSQLGLKYILEEAYPDKTILAIGEHNANTSFLGDLDECSDEVYHGALGIIVDVGDIHRVVDQRFLTSQALIKIDHHPLTETFADLEWVDTSYAAVTEMIIDLVEHNQDRLSLNEKAARVLYAGLLTDTGRFYYDSVTERTLRHGAKAYAFDFDKQALYADLYYQSIEELKLRGYILTHFKQTQNGLGYMIIDDALLNQFKIDAEYAATLTNILSNIKEVMMWIFFVEYKERDNIRVEFRSRGPIVNTFAKRFGGGGHKWASGAIADNWSEVDHIIQEADLLCQQFNQNN